MKRSGITITDATGGGGKLRVRWADGTVGKYNNLEDYAADYEKHHKLPSDHAALKSIAESLRMFGGLELVDRLRDVADGRGRRFPTSNPFADDEGFRLEIGKPKKEPALDVDVAGSLTREFRKLSKKKGGK